MRRALGLLLFIAAGIVAGCRQAEVAAEQSATSTPETVRAVPVRLAGDEQRLTPYLVAHGRAREGLRAMH